MATTSTATLSSSSTLLDVRAVARQPTAAMSTQCVTLPTLPPPPQTRQQNRDSWKPTTYCRKIARNMMALAAAGDALVTEDAPVATGDAPAEVAATESPEILKTIQDAWDKMEDKYAISSLAVAAGVALWGCTGMISAIDRLPLIPGVLELVGIGYSGWFAYKNLVSKPDRDALLQKINGTYKEIVESSL